MAAEYKEIREAIGEIARQDPVIRTALQRLRARGVLDGIEARVFSGEEDPDDCCENDPGPEDMEDDEDPDDEDTPDGKNPGGEDPTSGEKKKKNMDGNYELPGGERVPWDEAGCVPDDTWQEGYVWELGGSIFGATPQQALDNAESSGFLDNSYNFRLSSTRDTNSPPQWYAYESSPKNIPGVPWQISGQINRSSCASAPAYCVDEAPCVKQEWPPDGECQEALIGGKFVPHPDDPDCGSSAPRDYQILCDDDGYCVAYVPMKDGGHMRFQVDESGAYAGGNTTYYDENGSQYDTGAYSPEDVKFRAANPDSLPPAWTGG